VRYVAYARLSGDESNGPVVRRARVIMSCGHIRYVANGLRAEYKCMLCACVRRVARVTVTAKGVVTKLRRIYQRSAEDLLIVSPESHAGRPSSALSTRVDTRCTNVFVVTHSSYHGANKNQWQWKTEGQRNSMTRFEGYRATVSRTNVQWAGQRSTRDGTDVENVTAATYAVLGRLSQTPLK
jgi:hypothetical protein